ncbi:MAG: vitamin K epoxide reductase family protein [Cyanobacteria bacterium RM1_2_2]|nr:vitamin K epoxide reductase family protein [Cyanobacteria bacterium RM1_2_2]
MSSRRKPTPWIHRWSRPIIGAVAGLGMLNTGYLTVTKLFGGDAACPTSGCQQVLSSQYAQVFGLPLSLFGFLAYAGILALALAPLAVNPDKNKPLRNELENWTWLLLFLGATAMLIFSGYLMFIMATKFVAVYGTGGLCFYCIASALFALTIFILTLIGRAWEDIGQLVFSGVIVAMITLVGTGVLYSWSNPNSVANAPENTAGEVGPAVTTASGPSEIALAQHLTSIGAKMYSAFWCPHCHDQKQLFGAEAAAQIPYVECDPTGQNSQTALCKSKTQVKGYPTWEINGQFYSGTQTLQQLAEYSGYQGPRDFKAS